MQAGVQPLSVTPRQDDLGEWSYQQVQYREAKENAWKIGGRRKNEIKQYRQINK
jgi:hypothetical protein